MAPAIPRPIEPFTLVEHKAGRKRAATEGTSPQPKILPFVSHHVTFESTHDWVVYYNNGPHRGERVHKVHMEREQYESKMLPVSTCIDWEQFEEKYRDAVMHMPRRGCMWLFKNGISPVWEDPANSLRGAGRWVLPTSNRASSLELMKHVFAAEATGQLQMNGVLLTQKFGQDMVMVWTSGTQDQDEAQTALHQAMVRQQATADQLQAIKFKLHKVGSPKAQNAESRQLSSPREVDSDSGYESMSPKMSPVLKWRQEPNRFSEIAEFSLG